MFIIEILIYVLFAWSLSYIAREYEYNESCGDGGRKYLWIYIIFFTIITAIRWRVGLDSPAYLRAFYRGVIVEDSQEYLWNWLVMTIYNNKIHFSIGLGIAGFIQIYFLLKGCSNYSKILIWLPIVLFGGRYFLDMMNAVRQMIVACGLIYLLIYIQNKRPVQYIIGIILLSFIHHSALILLPLYIIAYFPFKKINLCKNRFKCLLIFIICVVVGQTPTFTWLINYAQPLIELIGYDDYSNRYAEISSGILSERLTFGPMMISQFLCSLMIIIFSPKLYNAYKGKVVLFQHWYLLAYCFSCLYFLLCNLGHIVIRPIQYLEFNLALMLALLLDFLYNSDEKFGRMAFYIVVLSIWLYISTDIYKVCGDPIEFSTYKTFFGRI